MNGQDSLSRPFVVDTSILVHNVRSSGLYQRVEEALDLFGSSSAPHISIVSVGELMSLAMQFGWGEYKRRRMTSLISSLVVIPLEHPGLVDAYAMMDNYSRRRGQPRGKNDLWIAATAYVLTARLVTCDRDFDHLHSVYFDRLFFEPSTVS